MWRGVSVSAKPTIQPISLADMKLRLRVDASEDDGLIDALISEAVSRVDGANGLGIAIMAQTWKKAMDAFPGCILLPGWPVTGVTSIQYVDVDGATQTLDPADYRVGLDQEPVRVVPAFGQSWPSTRGIIGSVTVLYSVGVSTIDEVPGDLKTAVAMLVGSMFENREATVVGASVDVVPLGVEDIFAAYRRGLAA